MSNVCEGGVDLQQKPAQMQCPLTPPRGLQVSIRGEAVAVRPGEDVLFVVRQEQVSGGRPARRPGVLMQGHHHQANRMCAWTGVLSASQWPRAAPYRPALSKLQGGMVGPSWVQTGPDKMQEET